MSRLTGAFFFMNPLAARVIAMSIEAKQAINVAPAVGSRHDGGDFRDGEKTAGAASVAGPKASRPRSMDL